MQLTFPTSFEISSLEWYCNCTIVHCIVHCKLWYCKYHNDIVNFCSIWIPYTYQWSMCEERTCSGLASYPIHHLFPLPHLGPVHGYAQIGKSGHVGYIWRRENRWIWGDPDRRHPKNWGGHSSQGFIPIALPTHSIIKHAYIHVI